MCNKNKWKYGSMVPGKGLGLGIERESFSKAWPKSEFEKMPPSL